MTTPRARRLGAALAAFDRRDLDGAVAGLAELACEAPDDRQVAWLLALARAGRREPVDSPDEPEALAALSAAAILLARGDAPGAWARLAPSDGFAAALRALPDPVGSFARSLAVRLTQALGARLAAAARHADAIAAETLALELDPALSAVWRRLHRRIVGSEPAPPEDELPALRASLADRHNAANLIRAARVLERRRPPGIALDMAGLRHVAGPVVDAGHHHRRTTIVIDGLPAFLAVEGLIVMRTRYANGDVGFWPWTGDGAFVAFGVPVGERGPMMWMPHVSDDARYVVGRLPGRLVDVSQPHVVLGGRNNHYHFLIDHLPSMLLAAREPRLAGLPIVVQDRLPAQLAAARSLGVPARRLVAFDALTGSSAADTGLRFARAWHALDLPVDARVRLLRASAPPVSGGPRRVLIRRDDGGRVARRLENEDEIAAMLAPLGFVTLTFGRLDFAAQLAAVANAEIVVGAHGAALANIVFMRPGARVVELLNGPTAEASAFLVYRRLAEIVGLEFRRVVGAPRAGGRSGAFPPDQPFRCAPEDVLAAVS